MGRHISTPYSQVFVTVSFLSKDDFFCTNMIIKGKLFTLFIFPIVYLRTKALLFIIVCVSINII